ncbi:MAG: O-antigen ligase family protein [Nitrospira sp.]
MRYLFIILLVALIAKDILPLGDRYVLRGVTEGMALAVGAGWLLTHPFQSIARRYLLILIYLGVLVITSFFSQRPFFVIFQVMSLASVALFFIAYVESSRSTPDIFQWNLFSVGCAFLVVCMGSLVLLVAKPQLVFEITPEGNRFRGLFNEPAMMGAVSGLLLGLSAFGRFSWLVRVGGALAAVPCLYLTGSRTSWGATAAGLLITGLIYIRRKHAWVIALAFAGIIGSLSLVVLDIHMGAETQSKVIRSGSIGTLSGRTVLWDLALEKYQNSPFFGFGFTTGSDALAADMGDTLSTAFGVNDRSQQKAFSLHSGYIQALLDSGAIGASLYLSILGLSLWRLLKHDGERRHGAEMYCLVFFSISNLTDTIIFGAAVFYEVFYWYLSVVALSTVAVVQECSLQDSIPGIDNRNEPSSHRQEVPQGTTNGPKPMSSRQYPLLQE